jgi:aryl-alcohol dehydrogenase-like predicted oxidoreductase
VDWIRTLGPTGPCVSAIALGLAALGRPGYLNLGHGEDLGDDRSVAALELRTHEVLDAAWAAGVRYFDAARSYGRAEDFLGSWLSARAIPPSDVTVGSKWGYTYTADWQVDADPPEVKDLSADQLRRQLQETRARLGSHLVLYQIHSATVSSGVLDDHEVLDELAALRATGVRVGLSVSGTEQAATIERALEVGGFDSVQATWNLLERSAESELRAAHESGLGVIIKEALANGRLAGRGAENLLIDVAGELATTPDAVAIAAALARPWVDVVLSGATTIEQLDSNLAARSLQLDAGIEKRLATLVEEPDAYWERRSALPWT